eukprot:GFUD01023524.1.p1 GENE.GFUD01023524.1~~GFUD01023524.1.p1  ORF type:complete len:376 (-),score=117.97 GFUD01023524.1:38-1165(-)
MESLYFRPRNGALQKVFASEVKNRTVFKFHRRNSDDESEPAGDSKPDVPRNLSGKVIKLYDQCMELLSYYTHCFESLVDFPEDFGKEIFNKAVNKLGVDNENTKKTVQIYCEAYPETFLPQCKLTNMVMINNYELCLPMVISSTVKLDLTGCQLDDDHDLLGQLVHLSILEVLSLADNLLSDRGLRRLLLPAGGGKQLTRLRYLDLANNRLEKRALARVNNVSTLKTIVLGEKDFRLEEMETCLKSCFRQRQCPRFEKVETLGFGKVLLEKWTEESKIIVKPKPKHGGFYSKPKVHLDLSLSQQESQVPKNKVMFERVKVLEQVSMNVKTLKPIKRKADTEESLNTKKKIKIVCSSPASHAVENEFDQSLLSLYM